MERELEDWAALGVDAHFKPASPWYAYHELFRDKGARLVGAEPGEVVMMNSLTMNLHVMMTSFYRPTAERHAILIDTPTFPSDLYAVRSQIAWHGYDPDRGTLLLTPRQGEDTLRTADIEALLEERGDEIALTLLSGVNFVTGQAFDMDRITRAAHRAGCIVGFDLAHAAGNLPLSLHDWNVDFAAWCSYKYLNAGPGAVGGCFVHARHGADPTLPRFAGWWGNDPATRFRMQLEERFVPVEGAEGWQVSNPPILAMAPLLASLDIFDDAGMPALRTKSRALTAYLLSLLERIPGAEVVTPRDPEARGSQISIRVPDRADAVFAALEGRGIVPDRRPPDILRVAPVPLYNTFADVRRFADALARTIGSVLA